MNDQIREKIESKIKDIDKIPTLPIVYSRISRLITNPKTTAKDISKVVEEDQALTARVLKIVNSGFYGFPQKVATVSHAIVILGFNEIRDIAFSASVINLFGEQADGASFNHEAFWQHSLAVGACARIIVQKLERKILKNPEEAFTAGLMHDIGKVIEDQFMHDDFKHVLVSIQNENISMLDAEQKHLGFSHQEVGLMLAERWKLPETLANVIGTHNNPISKENTPALFPLISVVHLADIIARALELGFGGDSFIPELEPKCFLCLGLKKGHIEVIMNEAEDAYNELSGLGVV